MMKIGITMKISQTEAQLRDSALAALKHCLQQVPDADVSISWGTIADGIMLVLVAYFTQGLRKSTLLAEIKKSGEPLHALNAFNQLERYRQAIPGMIRVFIAPYISPETAEICRFQNVNYLDLAGNCHFAFDSVYIHVEGKPNPAAHSRPLRSLYQPKAERVLRVLLAQPSKLWRLQALADEAGVSVGQVFKVKELLKEKDWLEETDLGIFLMKPREMLAAWAEHYRFSKHSATTLHTLTDLTSFEQDFSRTCLELGIPCAFTALAAAARYAPYAKYQRTTAYVSGDLANLRDLFDLAPVETGANVVLITPYDDGVFYGTRQYDISLVSPIQTYLDFQSTGGRGREAADVLLQKEIVPNW
jgi:hypothetical protein